ncbi:MAG: BspA family leucine-rich repeat surface protein [Bacteroidetes bacterium]|nr:BspA family leucine-rich repeat surface protein [Bacteroidota bacterium]
MDNWYTSNVTNMYLMFKNATSFNQSIGNWHLNQNDTILQMLNYCGMDCMNYSATISGWSNNPITPMYRLGKDRFNFKYKFL